MRRNGNATLEMKPLHISHGLVDTTDRRGVAYGPFGSVSRLEFRTVGATETDLVQMELLGSTGMPGEDVGLIGGEKFNEVGADVTLSVGEGFSIVDSS